MQDDIELDTWPLALLNIVAHDDAVLANPAAQKVHEAEGKWPDMISASSSSHGLGLGGQAASQTSWSAPLMAEQYNMFNEQNDAQLIEEMQISRNSGESKSGKEEKTEAKADSKDAASLIADAMQSGLVIEPGQGYLAAKQAENEQDQLELQFSAGKRQRLGAAQSAEKRLAEMKLPKPRKRSNIDQIMAERFEAKQDEFSRKPPANTYKDSLQDRYLSVLGRLGDKKREETAAKMLQEAQKIAIAVNGDGQTDADGGMTDDLFPFVPVREQGQKVARLH